MKKKAVQQKQGAIARFCSSQEKKARISLILAAAVVVTTFGSVCTAAILLNSDTTVVPDDIVELNAAEQYLASAALQAATTETDGTDLTTGTEETGAVVNLSGEPRETKRGGLTGEHVVDIRPVSSQRRTSSLTSPRTRSLSTTAQRLLPRLQQILPHRFPQIFPRLQWRPSLS